MNARLSSRDRDLLQRYLDGQTSTEESRLVDEKLASDAAFSEAYAELKRLSELLVSGDRLESDPAFWTRFSGRLREHKQGEHNLLPFPQKYLPLAASGIALLVLLSFSYVFENRLSFLRFWETQGDAVMTAYEKTVQEGSFIPLFSGFDNDKTLQFALYGSIPLDGSGGSMLNVDERTAEGYRIEVQKEQPRKQKKITVADFVAEVRPTNIQKAAIESLLTDGRRELEGAVLVGQNEAVAINADLSRLNRAMVSGIVSVLEPEQRMRLKRLLTEGDAAYNYSSRSRNPQPSEVTARGMMMPSTTNRFVVLSPETVLIQALTIDMERIHKEMKESQVRFREVQALRKRSIRWLVNEPLISTAVPVPGEIAPRISLKSRKDRLTIQVYADTSDSDLFIVETGFAGGYVEGSDSLAMFEFDVEATIPRGKDAVTAPNVRVRVAPLPDTAKPRKPFKLDIN